MSVMSGGLYDVYLWQRQKKGDIFCVKVTFLTLRDHCNIAETQNFLCITSKCILWSKKGGGGVVSNRPEYNVCSNAIEHGYLIEVMFEKFANLYRAVVKNSAEFVDIKTSIRIWKLY
jgi:hypothetical protein